ncbi:MAG TPA: alpha/beta hydrolase [Methylocella sp.]|jgi:pimeloyl-ACP methyl ester carboxylesterase|nr:alpha/beta hydrolase [Methylocella sp.]
MKDTNLQRPFASRFCSAPDGLKLYLREYGSIHDPGIPAVCLAGLTRNSADFGPLASALASGQKGPKRRVLALDYRGRGLSDHDRNWRNYSLEVENKDVLAVLAAMEIDRAIFIGTSRGGLHTMLMTATRPCVICGAVLNDIGPVLEPRGMARIRSYVGKLPVPNSIGDAVSLLKELMSERFSGLSKTDWETYAKMTYSDDVGRIAMRYDRNLMKSLEDLDLEQPLPAMWGQFDGLRGIPLLIIRGANSDLLSIDTVNEMLCRHPDVDFCTVKGQGHAPLLIDEETIERICGFAARLDDAAADRAAAVAS